MSTIVRVTSRLHLPYYVDTRDQRQYKWIGAGFAWPSNRPGAVAIIGVDRAADLLTHIYRMRLLDLFEEESPSVLVKRAVRASGDFAVMDWYGDPRSPLNQFIHKANEVLAMLSQRQFFLMEPHGFRDKQPMLFFANAVKEVLATEYLDLREWKELIYDRFYDMPPENVEKVKVFAYPVISALGFAVSSLPAFKPWEAEERRRAEVNLNLDDHWIADQFGGN